MPQPKYEVDERFNPNFPEHLRNFTFYKKVKIFDWDGFSVKDLAELYSQEFPHLPLEELRISASHDIECDIVMRLNRKCCPHRLADPEDKLCEDAIVPDGCPDPRKPATTG